MNIRQKMAFIVISSILCVALPGSILIYQYMQHKILVTKATELSKVTSPLIASATQRFLESENKLKSLAQLLEAELKKPVRKEELNEFYSLMEHNSDGVWRNKKSIFNGTQESGVFLPTNPNESDLQKIQHLRIKKVMDVFGAAAKQRMENVWFLSPDRSEIIFDKQQPNFAFDQKADNDYTKTPWVTYTTPELNPNKELRFTPPLFDPVPKNWMISALYPIYSEGKWGGSLGEDMMLTGVLAFMFQSEQIFEDTQHFLIDKDGNFVLAGAWQKNIEATTESIKPDFGENSETLTNLFQINLTNQPALLLDNLEINQRQYVAIGMMLEPLGWRYYRLTPVDKLMESTHEVFVILVGMILFISALSGLLIFIVSGKSITARIKILTDGLNCYASNHAFRLNDTLDKQLFGADEMTLAGHSFDNMANEIQQNATQKMLVEESLRKSELMFSSIVNQSLDGIVLIDPKTKGFVQFNNAACEMFGYSSEEFEKLTLFDLQSSFSPEQVNQAIQSVIEQNEIQFEVEYRKKNGGICFIFVKKKAVIIENETFILSLWVDMTEHKLAEIKLRENEEVLKFALEGSGDGVWDWNIEEGSVTFSEKWKTMLGYHPDEIGTDLSEWSSRVHSDDIEKVMKDIQNCFDKITKGYANEHRILCKDGSYKWVLARGIITSHDENGKPLRMIGTHSDISEHKKNEQALIEAKELAEAAALAKSTFLANMSHEIRTPMNAIIGLSELALNKEMPAEIYDYLVKINHSSKGLLEILNDILDFSKIEAGKMTLDKSEFNIIVLQRNLRNLFEPSAESKNLAFHIDIDTHIPNNLLGDVTRIQQVLANLLSNAIKFTNAGQITFKMQLLEEIGSNARIRFSVSDTGMGISEADQIKLFKPFSQLDSSITRRFGGSGLGLAISNNLLKLMGSKLLVDSVLGQGTIFSFNLCLNIASMQSALVATKKNNPTQAGDLTQNLRDLSQSISGAQILVAEDNFINQQIVKEFLTLSGMNVSIANNGLEALGLLKTNHYDAILMDIHMPEMDGLSATKEIRLNPNYSTLPIIALTAGVTTDEYESYFAVGMNDVLPKPVNPEKMIQILSKWIQP